MKTEQRRGRFAVIAVPYAWLLVFFLLPFLVVARISVSEMEATTIKDVVTWQDGALAFSSDGFFANDRLLLLKLFVVCAVAAALHSSLLLGFSSFSKSPGMASAAVTRVRPRARPRAGSGKAKR